jgi:hypothetical protein
MVVATTGVLAYLQLKAGIDRETQAGEASAEESHPTKRNEDGQARDNVATAHGTPGD